MTVRTPYPEWMRADFTVKRTPRGYIVMDGDTPVSNAPHERLASANYVMRDCQQRRELSRARWDALHA